MYTHILIATDGSELAAKAVASGIELAKRLGAKLTAVTASEPWTTMMVAGDPGATFPTMEYEKAARENALRILDAVSSMAKAAGVACETVHVMTYPADAIVDTATSKGCDLIVMASHGRRGIARVLLGSQAVNVLTHSKIPVLICR
jgi:nucleotide-binding universal stress UspA family protein